MLQGFYSVPNTPPGLITATLTALVCAAATFHVQNTAGNCPAGMAWMKDSNLSSNGLCLLFFIFCSSESLSKPAKKCSGAGPLLLEVACWLILHFSPLQPVTSPAPRAGELLRATAYPARIHHTCSKLGSAWTAVARGSTQGMASALVNTCERNALHKQESIFHFAVQQLELYSCLTSQLHPEHS